MNTPLGRAAGNWLEVKEAFECLQGTGDEGLRELVLTLAAWLLVQTGRAKSFKAAKACATERLNSGLPITIWQAMLAAQGADLDAFQRKLLRDHTARVVMELKAAHSGYVTRCDARIIGEVVRDLGGGRLTKDSVINPDVGVDRIAKPGEAIAAGQPLLRIHANTKAEAEAARRRLKLAFEISPRRGKPGRLVAEIVT